MCKLSACNVSIGQYCSSRLEALALGALAFLVTKIGVLAQADFRQAAGLMRGNAQRRVVCRSIVPTGCVWLQEAIDLSVAGSDP